MLSRALLKSQQRALQAASLTMQGQVRPFSGGGEKKPPMPATETDFDVIFVGKFALNLTSRQAA